MTSDVAKLKALLAEQKKLSDMEKACENAPDKLERKMNIEMNRPFLQPTRFEKIIEKLKYRK